LLPDAGFFDEKDGIRMTGMEKEWPGKASRFIKPELKRAGISYKELAERLNKRERKWRRD